MSDPVENQLSQLSLDDNNTADSTSSSTTSTFDEEDYNINKSKLNSSMRGRGRGRGGAMLRNLGRSETISTSKPHTQESTQYSALFMKSKNDIELDASTFAVLASGGNKKPPSAFAEIPSSTSSKPTNNATANTTTTTTTSTTTISTTTNTSTTTIKPAGITIATSPIIIGTIPATPLASDDQESKFNSETAFSTSPSSSSSSSFSSSPSPSPTPTGPDGESKPLEDVATRSISRIGRFRASVKRQETVSTTTPSTEEGHLTVQRRTRLRALSTSDRPPISVLSGGSDENIDPDDISAVILTQENTKLNQELTANNNSDNNNSDNNNNNNNNNNNSNNNNNKNNDTNNGLKIVIPVPNLLTPDTETSPQPTSPRAMLMAPKKNLAYANNPTIETHKITKIETDDDFEVLNQYTLYNELGRGAYGVVKLAIDNRDGSRYAIKVVSKKRLKKKAGLRMPPRKPIGKPIAEESDESSPLANVKREIAILKKLSHPNVVKLNEVIDDIKEDNMYLVFELVEGGAVMDIQEVMTADPFPENLSRKYFVDLLMGIEYLHRQGIIHRDIKPGNLLLTENNRIKITDFGVSQVFSDGNDVVSKAAGSPAFMAPEALNTEISQYSGIAVDVWAMGVTLYCFTYGRCPFISSSIVDLHEKIRNDDLKFPQKIEINPQLKDLMSKMLTKDPHARITIPEIKCHPWITRGGLDILPDDSSEILSVTEQEVESAVHTIISLSTLILLKSMGKRRSLSASKARGVPPPELENLGPSVFIQQAPGFNDSYVPLPRGLTQSTSNPNLSVLDSQ